jgi:hypothetical protein
MSEEKVNQLEITHNLFNLSKEKIELSNLPSFNDFDVLIKDDEIRSGIINCYYKITNNIAKIMLNKFELDYLKVINDYFNKKEHDFKLTTNQEKWVKEEVLEIFNDLDYNIHVKDSQTLTLILNLVSSTLEKSSQDSIYLYETLYELKSLIEEKKLLEDKPTIKTLSMRFRLEIPKNGEKSRIKSIEKPDYISDNIPLTIETNSINNIKGFN